MYPRNVCTSLLPLPSQNLEEKSHAVPAPFLTAPSLLGWDSGLDQPDARQSPGTASPQDSGLAEVPCPLWVCRPSLKGHCTSPTHSFWASVPP